MKKVCIIGLGQVGGSLGRALKLKSEKYFVIGIDKNPAVLKTAKKMKAADIVSSSLLAAKDSDIAVICAPVDSIFAIYNALSKIIKPEAIITDAGSVKLRITDNRVQTTNKIKTPYLNRKLISDISFIGAHPMAGTEKNGIGASRADMYKDAKVVITNTDKRLLKQQKQVEDLWKDAGSVIVKMPPKKHDELVALTSHLPHIIAFALNKIYKQTQAKNKNIKFLTAGSFKSMTRVAVSSADMWAPIFQMNSKNIEKYLKVFIEELKIFKKNLNKKNKLKQKILACQNAR